MSRRSKREKRIRELIHMGLAVVLLVGICIGIRIITSVVTTSPDSLGDLVSGMVTTENDETKQDAKKDTLFTVCIDAGHGGKDIGSDYKKRLEKDDNLKLSLLVEKYLKEEKVEVVMTRDDDFFLKLSKRCKAANDAKADYMISLHRNKGDGTGVETWVYSQADEKTMELAQNIEAGLSEAGIQRDRGVKKGTQKNASENYYITQNAKMPACIIELGFINNQKDNALYDEHIEDYAKAIAQAIVKTYTDAANAGTDETKTTEPAKADGTGNADTATTGGTDKTDAENAGQDNASGDTAKDGENQTSHTIQNTQIDTAALSNDLMEWGQGTNVDDENRPVSAISYQEKYATYQANFIGPDEKKIYLTFDEGYEVGFTPSILDTLKEKDVQAVFFVTKPYAEQNADNVKRMIAEGHAVGNHSVTHPSAGLPSESIEQQQAEITGNHDYIKEQFGYEMHLFRYPAGKFSEQSMAVVNNCNYKSVFWSFAYLDYDVNNQPDETASLEKLMSRLHPGAIYLLHAESQTNTNILGSFIDQVRAAGYEICLFD